MFEEKKDSILAAEQQANSLAENIGAFHQKMAITAKTRITEETLNVPERLLDNPSKKIAERIPLIIERYLLILSILSSIKENDFFALTEDAKTNLNILYATLQGSTANMISQETGAILTMNGEPVFMGEPAKNLGIFAEWKKLVTPPDNLAKLPQEQEFTVEIDPETESKHAKERINFIKTALDASKKSEQEISSFLDTILTNLTDEKRETLKKTFMDSCAHKDGITHPTDKTTINSEKTLIDILQDARKSATLSDQRGAGGLSGASRAQAYDTTATRIGEKHKELGEDTSNLSNLLKILKINGSLIDLKIYLAEADARISSIERPGEVFHERLAWAAHLPNNQVTQLENFRLTLQANPNIAARFYSALPRYGEFQERYHAGELPVLDALDKTWREYEAQRFTCSDEERYQKIIHLQNLVGFCLQQDEQVSILTEAMKDHLNSVTAAIQEEVGFIGKILPLLPVHPGIHAIMSALQADPTPAKKARSWARRHPYYTAFIALLTLAAIATIIVAAFPAVFTALGLGGAAAATTAVTTTLAPAAALTYLGLTAAVAPLVSAITTVFSTLLIGLLPQGFNNFMTRRTKKATSKEKFDAYQKEQAKEAQITLASESKKPDSPHKIQLALNDLAKGNLEAVKHLPEGIAENPQYREQLLLIKKENVFVDGDQSENANNLKALINAAEIQEGQKYFDHYMTHKDETHEDARNFLGTPEVHLTDRRGNFIFKYLEQQLKDQSPDILTQPQEKPVLLKQFLDHCLDNEDRQTLLINFKNQVLIQELVTNYANSFFQENLRITPRHKNLIDLMKKINIETNPIITGFIDKILKEKFNPETFKPSSEHKNLIEFIHAQEEMKIDDTEIDHCITQYSRILADKPGAASETDLENMNKLIQCMQPQPGDAGKKALEKFLENQLTHFLNKPDLSSRKDGNFIECMAKAKAELDIKITDKAQRKIQDFIPKLLQTAYQTAREQETHILLSTQQANIKNLFGEIKKISAELITPEIQKKVKELTSGNTIQPAKSTAAGSRRGSATAAMLREIASNATKAGSHSTAATEAAETEEKDTAKPARSNNFELTEAQRQEATRKAASDNQSNNSTPAPNQETIRTSPRPG